MSRTWVVLGDVTASGGRVITASQFTFIDGKGVARKGDQATCPSHNGVFAISEGDPTTQIDGADLALHGCKLACGCAVLATQQVRVLNQSGGGGQGGGGGAASSSGTAAPTVSGAATPTASGIAASVASGAAAALVSGITTSAPSATAGANATEYDEAIQFVGPTGALLANISYVLHLEDGSTAQGTTDEDGLTQRITTPAPRAIVKAELNPPEHSHGCCAAIGMPAQTVQIPISGAATNAANVGSSTQRVAVEQAEDRRLTSGEITMLRQVFGNSIDYSSVKIHNHGYWLFFGFQPDNTAVAPNGEIYMPADLFSADFSKELSNRRRRLLVHEMTHVWQHQLGYPLKRIRAARPNMQYGYTLATGKRLCDYNMEAQGNILADYFLLKFASDPGALYEVKYRASPNAITAYEKTLQLFLADPGNDSNLPKVTE